MDLYKEKIKCDSNEELSGHDLKNICQEFKQIIYKKFNAHFPDDPIIQLHTAIEAVFKSWNGDRAIHYRHIENIPDDMALLLIFRVWFSEIWVLTLVLVLHLLEIHQQEKISFMVSG